MTIFAIEMDIFGQTPPQLTLFFILYGITGVVPFMAALYLQLCPGNAFAPGVTPPVRLRRWAASFFAVIALSHVWWYLFYAFSRDIHSVSYLVLISLDTVTLQTTLAGTLLSMLQDRRRPVWPVFAAMIPCVALAGAYMVYPCRQIMSVAMAYVLLFCVLFAVYMVFAVRRYGHWLNDNYADLEHKKVWLSQAVTLSYLLLFILYTLADINAYLLMFLMHLTQFVLFGLLLWRVETLPQLGSIAVAEALSPSAGLSVEVPGATAEGEAAQVTPAKRRQPSATPITIDLVQIEKLLDEYCVAPQLYLQPELTLNQLALIIGTNRYYLSHYFSRQGITYNTYINNLRINHFINRFQEAVAIGRPFGVRQLVYESGYRSYSTFSLAFKQRTGQSVTAWMHEAEEARNDVEDGKILSTVTDE